MNKLTQTLNSLLYPKAVMVVYKDEFDHRFIELHEIDDKGQMQEAIPVSHNFLEEIADSFLTDQGSVHYGILPPNLLYSDVRKGHEKFIWYNLPRKRRMYFSENLHIENDEYYVPGVIYVAEGVNLKIYAFKGNKKPDMKTKLYFAPFFNTSVNGVCLGNANLKKPSNLSFLGLLEYWEKLFWDSEFSHLGNENPVKHNLVLVTKAAKDLPFKEREMKELNLTIKDILK